MSYKYVPTFIKMERNPHVIVFANIEPDKTKLSMDRWKVYEL